MITMQEVRELMIGDPETAVENSGRLFERVVATMIIEVNPIEFFQEGTKTLVTLDIPQEFLDKLETAPEDTFINSAIQLIFNRGIAALVEDLRDAR